MANKKQIRVFIGSPGDLSAERNAFRKQTEQLNRGFGDGANVEFIPLGWEDTLASTGPRTQSVFNQLIDSCDIFILVLSRRWGQDAPDSEYSSYTEEEFHTALSLYKKSRSPLIFIFFKRVDTASLADPGPQLQKILDFKLSLEETRSVRYWEFNDLGNFEILLSKHLRAFAKGEIPHLEAGDFQTPLPIEIRHELQETRKKLKQAKLQIKAEMARANNSLQKALQAEELALELAKTASELALDGKIERAKIMFSKAVIGSTRVKVILLAAEFYLRIGNFAEAEELFNKGRSGADDTIAGYFLMGLAKLATIRGDNNKAESIFLELLAIEEKLGRPNGVASAYGNLGTISKVRGDSKQAENLYRKALEVFEKNSHQEMMAVQYNNLGLILQLRGDLDQAESLFRKALKTNEKLNNQERMALAYGNLGNTFADRRDFVQAADMHRKALVLDEKIGHLEGQAADYNNLGNTFKNRFDLDKAEEMYQKSLTINKKLGHLSGVADTYGNLGAIYQLRGEMKQAEKMYRAALKIDEMTGFQEGVAISHLSLGRIFLARDDLKEAKKFFNKALGIFETLGATPRIEETAKALRSLHESRSKRHIKSSISNLTVKLLPVIYKKKDS